MEVSVHEPESPVHTDRTELRSLTVTLQDWSCEVLRAGGPGCELPGMADVQDTLLTPANGFQEMQIDPVVDIIEKDLLPQLTESLDGMDNALRRMQSDINRFVLERLRIDSLTKVNYSSVPDYDASNPRWKSDLVETSLEGTNFFVPVGIS